MALEMRRVAGITILLSDIVFHRHQPDCGPVVWISIRELYVEFHVKSVASKQQRQRSGLEGKWRADKIRIGSGKIQCQIVSNC
jgi:hypothetical protein